MSKLNAVALIGVLFLPMEVSGQIPPGYHVVQITDNDFFEYQPRNNNRGQIVFTARMGQRQSSEEIFLYDNGKLTRLTDDDVGDWLPVINDDGMIVWSRAIGPEGRFGPTYEIMIYRDGKTTRFTDNAADEYVDDLNNLGHFVWTRDMGPGCGGLVADIFFYDGNETRQITDDGERDDVVNQLAQLNDHGQITWTRYNFCENPWTSMVKLYSDGKVARLSSVEMFEPQGADINTKSEVVWSYLDRDSGAHPIVIWEDGRTSPLTIGRGARINEMSQVAFERWDADLGVWQVFVYRDFRVYQLTNSSLSSWHHTMNDDGEVVWAVGPVFESDIRYMKRFPFGDLNCDGSIDLLDVEPFIAALIDPFEYEKRYPACDPLLGDLNDDGSVDLLDVAPFIELLIR